MTLSMLVCKCFLPLLIIHVSGTVGPKTNLALSFTVTETPVI